MSYPPAPPPSGGVNPYGDAPEPEASGPAVPPVPPPSEPSSQPWQTPRTVPAYGTPPQDQGYGPPSGQPGYGGPSYGDPSRYSPYTAAGGYPGAPGYGGWIASSRDNGKGTGALVMGILSIVLCFGSLLAIGLGVGAILMGVQGRRAALAGTADNNGVATAGIVLGSIGVALGLVASLGYLSSLVTT